MVGLGGKGELDTQGRPDGIDTGPVSGILKNKKEFVMVSHPAGKGTKTIGINMQEKMAREIKARAESMQISSSNYCKLILKQWLDSGAKLTLSEES